MVLDVVLTGPKVENHEWDLCSLGHTPVMMDGDTAEKHELAVKRFTLETEISGQSKEEVIIRDREESRHYHRLQGLGIAS